MKDNLYNLTFQGQIAPGQNDLEVKKNLADRYKTTVEEVEATFFSGRKTLVKHGISYSFAQELKRELELGTGAIFSIEKAQSDENLASYENVEKLFKTGEAKEEKAPPINARPTKKGKISRSIENKNNRYALYTVILVLIAIAFVTLKNGLFPSIHNEPSSKNIIMEKPPKAAEAPQKKSDDVIKKKAKAVEEKASAPATHNEPSSKSIIMEKPPKAAEVPQKKSDDAIKRKAKATEEKVSVRITGITTTRKGGLLRIRSGPGAKYKIVARIENGKVVDIIGKKGGWYKVKLSGGEMGYAYTKFIQMEDFDDVIKKTAKAIEGKASAPITGIITTRKGGLLRIRSGPGSKYKIVTRIENGKVVDIIKKGGEWYKVKLPGGKTGYAYAKFIQVED